MSERGILFSAPMVRALLAGTKTQTRRVVKPQPPEAAQLGWLLPLPNGPASVAYWSVKDGRGVVASEQKTECPYGKPGDRLWVREAWRTVPGADDIAPRDLMNVESFTHYEADATKPAGMGKLRPGMFMPRWASRITLEVTGVRVERLNSISEADARAEGIERSGECNWRDYLDPHNDFTGVRRSYRSLWDSINGDGAWSSNPWVWAVSFCRMENELGRS
jgi:hypothetical protein